MKKIENIIENCKDCGFCLRYKHTQNWGGTAFICNHSDPKRLIAVEKSPARIEIPDWCPLETYKEVNAEPAASTQPQTIVLPGMPNLEWMTENLTGHGGTEINGRWYYTWKQAMAAGKQLGDGWRIPTREEFEQLCALGSTWDDERMGRWFGGNHDTDHEGSIFFPASGYRSRTSGALTNVGYGGYSWSSSPNSAGSTNAGILGFYASGAYPFNGNSRAYGFAVRCVREIRERI